MGFIKLILLIIWSVFCITLSLVVLLFTFNRKYPLKMARSWWAPGVLNVIGVKPIINGQAHINLAETYIIVANHSSYLDIPTLFNIIPINVHFIAKKELKKVPFLGWYMWATDMIFIDRKNTKKAKKSLEDASELIRKGKTVLIFPEGTVSEDGKIKTFKKGGFYLAKQSGVNILPIAHKGTDIVWPSGTNTKFKKHPVSVNIGEPIEVNNFESVNELAAHTKKIIEQLHSNI
jgi:1-acyl-sn-glycerol-3-phosphate acyltransferase